jgi:CRP-like cAMP-binding protein
VVQQRLLAKLDEPTREALFQAGHPATLPRGDFLVHEGDETTAVYLVVDGLLKIVKSAYDGRVSFLGLRREGTLVGELGMLTGASRSSSVQAVREARVIRIAADRFEQLLATYPALGRALLEEIAIRLREATLQMHDLMNADARTRIAARLVQLADDTAGPAGEAQTLALPVSQEELGDWAGLSRAGAVKALRALRDERLIETSRMSITITDLPAMRVIALV